MTTTTDHVDMSTIDPSEIVVGPDGQTLDQAAAEEAAAGARRRAYPIATAIVLPPPDGRRILREPGLVRYAHGLWSQGYPGEVVGVLVDTGAGVTEVDIRAALTVTVIDPLWRDAVGGAVTDYVWCELDEIRVAEPPPGLAEELAGMAPEDRAVAERVSNLAEIEPAPGYEERAVDRAKRESVL